MVEIARALTVEAKAVIFDEPTASLTDAEKVVLFDVIADLKSHGVGIIYISHRMEEIFRITDRISVLRDGTYRGTVNTADTDEEAVTQLMIGRKLDLSRTEATHALGDVALEVQGLSCGHLFEDVSFEVRRGEVVGGSTGWLVPVGPRLQRPCSGCASRVRAKSCSTDRKRGYIRQLTPSRWGSLWCPRIARGRGLCLA